MDNLTEKQLRWGYWFLTHKAQLKKILTIILIVLNIGLWGFSIFRFSLYFARTRAHQSILSFLTRDLVDFRMRTKFSPRELKLSVPRALLVGRSSESGLSKYDFAVATENPNSDWTILSLTYKFVWSGGESQLQNTFFLPEQTKHLLTLGQEVEIRPKSVQCEFLDISWRRVKEPLFEKIANLDIAYENVEFIPATDSFPARVQFEAINNSIYSFWNANFNIILLQGKTIVGLNSIPIEQFLTGQTRLITATWTEKLPQVSKVIVEPQINLLDPEIFMPLR